MNRHLLVRWLWVVKSEYESSHITKVGMVWRVLSHETNGGIGENGRRMALCDWREGSQCCHGPQRAWKAGSLVSGPVLPLLLASRSALPNSFPQATFMLEPPDVVWASA